MEYTVREIREDEYTLLDDFLYEAIFVPEGAQVPDRAVIYKPELQVYVSGFGTQKDDIAFLAMVDNRAVGAVWVRDMNDYGHVADGVPSFAIALYKAYRGMGIGTALMQTMLSELKKRGYKKASLSVQKENYAVRLYQAVGFETVEEKDEEYIMVCDLNRERRTAEE